MGGSGIFEKSVGLKAEGIFSTVRSKVLESRLERITGQLGGYSINFWGNYGGSHLGIRCSNSTGNGGGYSTTV